MFFLILHLSSALALPTLPFSCYPFFMRALWPEPKSIRVIAPAGPVDPGDLDAGLAVLRGRGFEVSEGKHLRDSEGYLAGSDEARQADLQAALDDPSVDTIWFGRGGYGTQRLLPALRVPPPGPRKLLAGFSDATALFSWAMRHGGFDLIYAPSVQELARPGVCHLDALWSALRGEPECIPAHGPAEPIGPSEVVGGCLSLLVTTCGTPWRPRAQGRFLFLEDVGERMYRLDRMLTHLSQAGWFENLAGVLLGSFTGMGPGEGPETVAARVRQLATSETPVIQGLPVGHCLGKMPLPLGVPVLWEDGAIRFPDHFSARGVPVPLGAP
jgi:muramoyltetrapeptide carboxypeptidase